MPLLLVDIREMANKRSPVGPESWMLRFTVGNTVPPFFFLKARILLYSTRQTCLLKRTEGFYFFTTFAKKYDEEIMHNQPSQSKWLMTIRSQLLRYFSLLSSLGDKDSRLLIDQSQFTMHICFFLQGGKPKTEKSCFQDTQRLQLSWCEHTLFLYLAASVSTCRGTAVGY